MVREEDSFGVWVGVVEEMGLVKDGEEIVIGGEDVDKKLERVGYVWKEVRRGGGSGE